MRFSHIGSVEIDSGMHSNFVELYAHRCKSGWKIRAIDEDRIVLGTFEGVTKLEVAEQLISEIPGISRSEAILLIDSY